MTDMQKQKAEQPGLRKPAPAVRPFRVHFPDEALSDMKRRIAATRWPDKETVADTSQGVPLALIAKQPDLGTAVILVPVLFGVAYLDGMPMRVFGVLSLCLLLAAPGERLSLHRD